MWRSIARSALMVEGIYGSRHTIAPYLGIIGELLVAGGAANDGVGQLAIAPLLQLLDQLVGGTGVVTGTERTSLRQILLLGLVTVLEDDATEELGNVQVQTLGTAESAEHQGLHGNEGLGEQLQHGETTSNVPG